MKVLDKNRERETETERHCPDGGSMGGGPGPFAISGLLDLENVENSENLEHPISGLSDLEKLGHPLSNTLQIWEISLPMGQ